MTMKVTPLTTYWSPDEAATAIELLDILREALWQTYGEQITDMHREIHDEHVSDDSQCTLAFDDDLPF